MKTRTFLKATLAAGLAAAAFGAAAQAYPSRPVKVIIPFPPGGTLDAVGRQLAQKLGHHGLLGSVNRCGLGFLHSGALQ